MSSTTDAITSMMTRADRNAVGHRHGRASCREPRRATWRCSLESRESTEREPGENHERGREREHPKIHMAVARSAASR